jgi:hypothetical protein
MINKNNIKLKDKIILILNNHNYNQYMASRQLLNVYLIV